MESLDLTMEDYSFVMIDGEDPTLPEDVVTLDLGLDTDMFDTESFVQIDDMSVAEIISINEDTSMFMDDDIISFNMADDDLISFDFDPMI